MAVSVIPSASGNLIPLLWSIGVLTMSLVADSAKFSKDENLLSFLSAFYYAKNVAPPTWFTAINGFLFVAGILGNIKAVHDFFFASCSPLRRFLELAGAGLFVANVYFTLTQMIPLEISVASMTASDDVGAVRDRLFNVHLIALGVMLLMWVHSHLIWSTQNKDLAAAASDAGKTSDKAKVTVAAAVVSEAAASKDAKKQK